MTTFYFSSQQGLCEQEPKAYPGATGKLNGPSSWPRGNEGVLLFEDLTLTHLLSQVPDRAALRGMYEKIVGPLLATPHGVILRETVWSLVDHEFNQNAAAKALGIHRNTMRARIQKIEALLGRSLKDARVRWDLFVAREIERIL